MNNNSLSRVKTNPLQYLWVLVVLDFTFQLFNFLPIFDRHYLFWIIGLGLVVAYSNGFFRGPSFLCMTIYIIIVFINYAAGDAYFNDPVKIFSEEALNFLFPAALSFYLFRNSDYALFKAILIAFGIFLIESTVVSYWANSLFPGIIRLQSSAGGAESNAALLQPFMSKGMTDYAFPHAIPILVPGLVYAVFNTSSKQRLLFLVVLAASVVLAYVSGSFTAFIMTVFSLLMSFLFRSKNRHKTILRLILVSIVVLPLVFSTDLQLMTVRSLNGLFPEESIAHKKLTDIENSVEYGEAEGGVYNRKEKYDLTLNTIAENFIIGTDKSTAGGHSAIPDRLAFLGIVGIIPYLLFICFQVKFLTHYLISIKKSFFYVGLMAALTMLTTKGASAWAIWFILLTLLPGLLWWIAPKPTK